MKNQLTQLAERVRLTTQTGKIAGRVELDPANGERWSAEHYSADGILEKSGSVWRGMSEAIDWIEARHKNDRPVVEGENFYQLETGEAWIARGCDGWRYQDIEGRRYFLGNISKAEALEEVNRIWETKDSEHVGAAWYE